MEDTAIPKFVVMVGEIHDLLTKIEKKSHPLLLDDTPRIEDASPVRVMTPLEMELSGLLHHAKQLLNRYQV